MYSPGGRNTSSLPILAVSVLLETGAATLRQAILGFAALEIAGGLVWLVTAVPAESKRPARKTGGEEDR